MNGRYLLDTNIIIALFASDSAIVKRLDRATEVFVPAVVLGELYYGARKSARIEANLSKIDKLASTAAVLGCDAVTAAQYGIVKNALREKGRPIPENDIWIAAIAKQHNLTLVSRDEHFREVAEPAVEIW
ncbi:MAG: type II toxin-antitoxin system VapC family toxin [Proteobacteria bacterium]|nr:type II toxin-antitoxin system VapC family toxin [Pseudomonadota bacterium]